METKIYKIAEIMKCILLFTMVTSLLISVTTHDGTVYQDCEIDDYRYFVTTSRYGRTCEKIDVFYGDTKTTVSVSSIRIDTSSFVRVNDDIFNSVEVHMTKEDYLNCVGQSEAHKQTFETQ